MRHKIGGFSSTSRRASEKTFTYVSRVDITIVIGISHDFGCLSKDRDSVRVETDTLVAELCFRHVALDLSASSTSTGARGVGLSSSKIASIGLPSEGCGGGCVLQKGDEGEDGSERVESGREHHGWLLVRTWDGWRRQGAGLCGGTS